jgi:HTH-type transcriptional regulator / antitoxin HigA
MVFQESRDNVDNLDDNFRVAGSDRAHNDLSVHKLILAAILRASEQIFDCCGPLSFIGVIVSPYVFHTRGQHFCGYAGTQRYPMQIKPIKTTKDYRAALKLIESLMAAKTDTPEGDRLDILTTLVEAYERSHFPMELPDAVEAIKFRMDQAGLTLKDLEPVIGRKNRVYEVLSRRRPLTLRMIEGLHVHLGIPAESLLRQRVDQGTTSTTKRSTRRTA